MTSTLCVNYAISFRSPGFLNEEEEEAAKMEEEEARLIQKRLMSEIDDADLPCDLLTEVTVSEVPIYYLIQMHFRFYKIYERFPQVEEDESKNQEKIEVDLSQMSEIEKFKLLKRECPELLTYTSDLKRVYSLYSLSIALYEKLKIVSWFLLSGFLTCVKSELLPALQFYKSVKMNNSEERGFVETFYQAIMK